MTVEDLQGRLAYVFSDPRLLICALTHSSHANEHRSEDNERLEFLGDAVLDLVATDLVFRQYPKAREGELSTLRSRLVSAEALVLVARDLQLGGLLLLGRGEAASGGREKASNLARAAEAVLGAVYLDGGFPRAFAVAEVWVRKRLDRLNDPGLGWKDPKSRLQEVVQGQGRPAPTYHERTKDGPAHRPSFHVEVRVGAEVLGYGQGGSKALAERNAAECALRDLGERP